MAIFRPGSLISELRGSIGDVTYSRNRQGPYAKAKLVQTNPDTTFQQAVRSYVAAGNAAWKLISDEEFKAWNDYVLQYPHVGRLPGKCIHSAYNEFVSRYIFRGLLESSAEDFSPFPAVRKSPWITATLSSETELSVSYDSLSAESEVSILVYATFPVSPSVRFLNPSWFKFIGAVDGTSKTGTIEFLTEYLARISPIEPSPGDRVGICIRAVNSDNFADSKKAFSFVLWEGSAPPFGTVWTLRNTPLAGLWAYVAWSGSLYVATGVNESTENIMTSPDGINWTIRDTGQFENMYGIAYGAGVFVVVSEDAFTAHVFTSTDGITWTPRTAAASRTWANVAWNGSLFVAVGRAGTTTDVMTSADGISWTSRTTPTNGNWTGIAWGNSIWVAVSVNGTTSSVMTSPDGITWTIRTAASDAQWRAVAFGNGLFVAVAFAGSDNRIMTSTDGITWTLRTPPANLTFYGIAYGNGVWIATASSGTGQRAVRSTDGITWEMVNTPADLNWRSVTYGNNQFVCVALSGSTQQVMTSP